MKSLAQEATKQAMEPEPLDVSFREEVELLAYLFWQQRGCPEGSPEEDWFRAEKTLTEGAGRN
jgi:hypothetical protein